MQDVPSPIDFTEIEEAQAWASVAMEKRPYRMKFFKKFEEELRTNHVTSVLELGSGPGFLAGHLLQVMPDIEYTAYDFSRAMHLLANERLGEISKKVNFLIGNFREESWDACLGKFDAVITLQAAHEVRHKQNVLSLFKSIKNLLHEQGIFLYCDHFYGDAGMKDNDLYLSPEEQEQCLIQAGFFNVKNLLSLGTLNFWFASLNAEHIK